jgi:flagellin-like hook-associated protein FlgL
MEITPIAVSGSQQRNDVDKKEDKKDIERSGAKLQTVLDQLATRSIERATDNVAKIPVAQQLQAKESGFKQISKKLVQASSLAQAARDGVQQVSDRLDRLQSLATEASKPDVPVARRGELVQEFQTNLREIDAVAKEIAFEKRPLLDGSVSGEDKLSLDAIVTGGKSEVGDITLTIPDLSTTTLLREPRPDLSNPDAAIRTTQAVETARSEVNKISAEVETFRQASDIVAAYVDSAAANQQASESVLQGNELEQDSIVSLLQKNVEKATAAQGNRLSPTLVKLVS